MAAAGALVLALLTWALASPSASAPDDDFHIANIYCLHDASTCRSDDWAWPWGFPWWTPDPSDRSGPEYEGARSAYPDLWQYQQPRALPCYVTNGSAGYSPDAAVSADCLNEEDPAADRPSSLDDLGYYPSIYYRLASLFTGDTIRESVVHWRVLNILVAVAVLSGSMLLSAPKYRRPLALAALTASMPLGLFLVSSVNPSAWLLIGTAAFLGPALTLLRERSSSGVLAMRVAFGLLCLVMMMGGRSEGVGHAAVLVVVALLLGLKAPRYVYATLLTLGLLAVLTAVAVIGSGAGKTSYYANFIWDGLGIGSGTSSLWDALLANPDFFFGAAASRLGWLDIALPGSATVAISAAFWGTAFLGIAVMFWRKAFAIALVGAALLLVPATIMAGGYVFQPTRYFLPLVYMLAFLFLVPDWGTRLPRWSTAQWIALGAALSIANSIALLYTTVRYVSGISASTANPLVFARSPVPDWWWGAWLSPFANWLLGSVIFAVGVALLFTLPSIRGGGELKEAESVMPSVIEKPQREG